MLDETAEKVLNYIESKAPRSGKAYGFAESFVAVSEGQGITKRIAIYSSKKGRLTHLLELSYIHRGGKFVRPRPFMRPAFDAFALDMVEQIKSIIEKGRSS